MSTVLSMVSTQTRVTGITTETIVMAKIADKAKQNYSEEVVSARKRQFITSFSIGKYVTSSKRRETQGRRDLRSGVFFVVVVFFVDGYIGERGHDRRLLLGKLMKTCKQWQVREKRPLATAFA